MGRISDNIFEEAVNELNEENEALRKFASEETLDKHAFDIPINPSALVGAITGSAIAQRKAKADILKRQMENEDSQAIQGNYYSQVQNIANNLKIIFTPFGVVFVVKDGAREITIETISTDEMNSSMFDAWQKRDVIYFKNMLLNKMYNEIQFVEQQFAKRIIENQLGIRNQISKKASADIDVNYLSFSEITEHIAKIKEMFEKNNEVIEKFGEILLKSLDKSEEYIIPWEFQRPVEKYASLSGVLGTFGLNINSKSIRSLQGQYLSPSYLANRVKIGFLPDRVVFIVDNKMVTSLLAMDMNHEGFEAFQKEDEKYFIKFFKGEAKKGVQRMKGKLPHDSYLVNQEKTAEEKKAIELKDIFQKEDVHPAIYLIALNKQYGEDWVNWDASVLIKSIEDDFNLLDDKGIADIPLNKILSIQACNNNLYPFENRHVFEKIIRAFNNKPIDFLEREDDDITLYDIVSGIDTIDVVTPNDNIYDNFNAEVFSYIVSLLAKARVRVFLPTEILDSDLKDNFYEALNDRLLDVRNADDIERIDDVDLESQTVLNNEFIFSTTLLILHKVRNAFKADDALNHNKFIQDELDKLTEVEEWIKENIRSQIIDNLNMDRILVLRSELLDYQLDLYNLK